MDRSVEGGAPDFSMYQCKSKKDTDTDLKLYLCIIMAVNLIFLKDLSYLSKAARYINAKDTHV